MDVDIGLLERFVLDAEACSAAAPTAPISRSSRAQSPSLCASENSGSMPDDENKRRFGGYQSNTDFARHLVQLLPAQPPGSAAGR